HFVISNGLPDGFSASMRLLPKATLPVDRTNTTTDDPAPWLQPHRAQQRLPRYYEPVRRRVHATVLTALRFSRLAGSLSPSTTRTAVSGHVFPRSVQEQQTGLTSPTC